MRLLVIFVGLVCAEAQSCRAGMVPLCPVSSVPSCRRVVSDVCVEHGTLQSECQVVGASDFCVQVPASCKASVDICAASECPQPLCVMEADAQRVFAVDSPSSAFSQLVRNLTDHASDLNVTNSSVFVEAAEASVPTLQNSSETVDVFQLRRDTRKRIRSAAQNVSTLIHSKIDLFRRYAATSRDFNKDGDVNSLDFYGWYVAHYYSFSPAERKELALVATIWNGLDVAVAEAELAHSVAEVRIGMIKKALSGVLQQVGRVVGVAVKRLKVVVKDVRKDLRVTFEEVEDVAEDMFVHGNLTLMQVHDRLAATGRGLLEDAAEWVGLLGRRSGGGALRSRSGAVTMAMNLTSDASASYKAAGHGVAPVGAPLFGEQVRDVLVHSPPRVPVLNASAVNLSSSGVVLNTTIDDVLRQVSGVRGFFVPHTHPAAVSVLGSSSSSSALSTPVFADLVSHVTAARGLFIPTLGSGGAPVVRAGEVSHANATAASVLSRLVGARGIFVPTTTRASNVSNSTTSHDVPIASDIGSVRGMFVRLPEGAGTAGLPTSLHLPAPVSDVDLIDQAESVLEVVSRTIRALTTLFEHYISLLRGEVAGILPINPAVFGPPYVDTDALIALFGNHTRRSISQFAHLGTVKRVLRALSNGNVTRAAAAAADFAAAVLPGGGPLSPAALTGLFILPTHAKLDATFGALAERGAGVVDRYAPYVSNAVDRAVEDALGTAERVLEKAERVVEAKVPALIEHKRNMVGAYVPVVRHAAADVLSNVHTSLYIESAEGALELDVRMCRPLPFGDRLVMCFDVPAEPLQDMFTDGFDIASAIGAVMEAVAGTEFRIRHSSDLSEGLEVPLGDVVRGRFSPADLLSTMASRTSPESASTTFAQVIQTVGTQLLSGTCSGGANGTSLDLSSVGALFEKGPLSQIVKAVSRYADRRLNASRGPTQRGDGRNSTGGVNGGARIDFGAIMGVITSFFRDGSSTTAPQRTSSGAVGGSTGTNAQPLIPSSDFDAFMRGEGAVPRGCGRVVESSTTLIASFFSPHSESSPQQAGWEHDDDGDSAAFAALAPPAEPVSVIPWWVWVLLVGLSGAVVVLGGCLVGTCLSNRQLQHRLRRSESGRGVASHRSQSTGSRSSGGVLSPTRLSGFSFSTPLKVPTVYPEPYAPSVNGSDDVASSQNM